MCAGALRRVAVFILYFAQWVGCKTQPPAPKPTRFCFLAFFRRLGRGHKQALSALFRLQVAAGEHRRLVYNALMLAGEVWSSTLGYGR